MIYNLQVLRALAALLVVTHHLDFVPSRLVGPAWLLPGHTGVDIFFVISGFVMVHTMARHPLGATDFMLNRIIRVAPLYWLTTLALAGLSLVLHRLWATQLGRGYLIKSLLFIPYYNDLHGLFPLLIVGWTLNYEMFFYAVMVLAIALVGPSIKQTVALVCIALGSLAVLGWLTSFHTALGRFYTSDILLEFGDGMVLALAFQRGLRVPAVAAVALLTGGFALLMAIVVTLPPLRGLTLGLPALAVVAGAVSLEREGWVLRGRVLQLLGASSYALYLVHPLVMIFLVPDVHRARVSGGSGYLLVAAAVVLTAQMAAVLLHLSVERPLTTWLRRRIGHRRMEVDAPPPPA